MCLSISRTAKAVDFVFAGVLQLRSRGWCSLLSLLVQNCLIAIVELQ